MVEWRRACFVGEEIVMCMNYCRRNGGRFVGEEMLMCVIRTRIIHCRGEMVFNAHVF